MTPTEDPGFEVFDYDHDDPDAWAAMEQAWLLISPPQPPTPEQLAQQGVNNDRLIADFDRAGIAYELVTDELGWAWLEWDFKDPETSEKWASPRSVEASPMRSGDARDTTEVRPRVP